jgi:ABC transporter, permease protein
MAKEAVRKKRLSRSIGGDLFIWILLFLLGSFIALPFVYSIVQSLKPLDELFVFPPRFYVVRPTLNNFYQVTQLTGNLWVPLSRYVFNSLFVTALGTAGHVLLASAAAFPLAKYRFPGSRFLFGIVVVSLLFTYEVTFLPSYVIMSKLHLIDSLLSLILPALAAPLGLFLMKQFMESIPTSIIEAATVDGAGTYRIFLRIVMPQVKPAWLTLVIFSFQSLWSRQGLEYIYSEQLKTLPTILSQITASGLSRAGAAAAIAVLMMIPPVAVFVITQSNVLETMAFSGIKE